MALHHGVHLGPYEIVALVDAGGMGEVYRARDPRLQRQVAIKVLAGIETADATRLQRFEREARAAAALSHPNILVVYDVGTEGGVPFIVSELLEGRTLREVIAADAPLPLRRVIDIAAQVGRGLAAAHGRGIVHRDLKPENLFICHDGTAKILDFGLARLTESSVDAPPETTVSLTGEHTVLGTLGYMAPEQLRGQATDHRADIFAFGAILYELLAGRRAFTGDTSADVMTAILTADPPELPAAGTSRPPALQRIVSRCLEKRPEARFQSASDLAFALEALSTPSGPLPAVTDTGSARRARRALIAGLAAVVIVAAAGVVLVRSGDSDPRPPTGPLRVQRLTEFSGVEEFPAISPDGRAVAFTAAVGGVRQIFVRLVAGGAPLQITTAAADHQQPRWSPDSSSIVYFCPAASGEEEGALWEVSAFGGAPRRITASFGGGDVGPADGHLVFFRRADGQVELVITPRDGSAARVVHRFAPGSYYWYPRWSPDGRWIAYQRGDGVRFDLYVVPAAGGEARQLTRDNALLAGHAWRADGAAIIYSSSRASTLPYLPTLDLWEAPLDGGAPVPLAGDEASYMYPDARGETMVVSRMRRQSNLWQFPVAATPRQAAARQLTHQTGHVHTPTASPDGAELAYLSDSGGHSNLWVLRIASGELRQLTHERDASTVLGVPIWSPDGRAIAFVSSRGNPGLAFGLWLVNHDGANLRNLVTHGFGAAWSPDARWVYYVERANDVVKKVPAAGGSPVTVRAEPARNIIGVHGSTLYFLVERALVDGRQEFEIRAADPEDGPSRVVTRLAASRLASWQVVNPALSPDGKWLAQALTDGLTTNVWVASTATGEWRRVTDFDLRPTYIARRVCWSADGRSIFAAVGEGDADIVRLER